MNETDWSRCEGLWDRLRWARAKAGASTEDAGRVIAKPAQTYRTYERPPGNSGAREIGSQDAILLARRWKVSWPWLISGEGSPFETHLSADAQEVGALIDQAPKEIVTAVKTLLGGRTGTNG